MAYVPNCFYSSSLKVTGIFVIWPSQDFFFFYFFYPPTSEILNQENKIVEIEFFFIPPTLDFR